MNYFIPKIENTSVYCTRCNGDGREMIFTEEIKEYTTQRCSKCDGKGYRDWIEIVLLGN